MEENARPQRTSIGKRPVQITSKCLRSTAAIWIFLTLVAPSEAQQVSLPLERYEALRAMAKIPAQAPPPPAASVAFESATLAVAVDERRAKIVQNLAFTVYDQGWHEVHLPALGSLIETRLESAHARLEVDGEWILNLEGVGRHTVTLTSAVPTERDASAARASWGLRLPTPKAAVVRGTIEVPAVIDRVEADAEAVIEPPETDRRWRFVAGGGAALDLRLSALSHGPARKDLPLRFVVVEKNPPRHGRGRREAWF